MISRRQEQDLQFPERYTIQGKEYGIVVGFYDKRNSSVRVKGDNLVFRFSNRLRPEEVQGHFRELLSKMVKKLGKSTESLMQKSFQEVLDAGEFHFGGDRYTIVWNRQRPAVLLCGNRFLVNPNVKLVTLEKQVLQSLRDRYEERMERYVRVLNEQTYGFAIGEVSLRLVDSKWGHCTPGNDIMINMKLLNARKEVLDYVIIHELAHVRIKNHSERFWREVERFFPHHKQIRKELRSRPPGVFE